MSPGSVTREKRADLIRALLRVGLITKSQIKPMKTIEKRQIGGRFWEILRDLAEELNKIPQTHKGYSVRNNARQRAALIAQSLHDELVHSSVTHQ